MGDFAILTKSEHRAIGGGKQQASGYDRSRNHVIGETACDGNRAVPQDGRSIGSLASLAWHAPDDPARALVDGVRAVFSMVSDGTSRRHSRHPSLRFRQSTRSRPCMPAKRRRTEVSGSKAVRKTRSPQTIGEEWPGPGSCTFQCCRSGPENDSVEVPSPRGPRNCGRFSAAPIASAMDARITAREGIAATVTGV